MKLVLVALGFTLMLIMTFTVEGKDRSTFKVHGYLDSQDPARQIFMIRQPKTLGHGHGGGGHGGGGHGGHHHGKDYVTVLVLVS